MAKFKKPASSTSKKATTKKAATKSITKSNSPVLKKSVKTSEKAESAVKKKASVKTMSSVKKTTKDKKNLDKFDKKEIETLQAQTEPLKEIEESKKAIEEFKYELEPEPLKTVDNSLYPTIEHNEEPNLVEEPVKEIMSVEPDAITFQPKLVSPGVFTTEKDEEYFIGQYPTHQTEEVEVSKNKNFLEKNKNVLTLLFGAILIVIFFVLISHDSKQNEVEVPVVSDTTITTKIQSDTPILLIPKTDSALHIIDTPILKKNETLKKSSYIKDSLSVEALRFQKPIKLNFETEGETLVTYYSIGDSLIKVTKTVHPNFK